MDIWEYISDGRLAVVVKVNAPKTKITGYDNIKKAVKLDVHATPEKGKANAEIAKFFSRLLKKKVEIVSGKTSKKKVLRVS